MQGRSQLAIFVGVFCVLGCFTSVLEATPRLGVFNDSFTFIGFEGDENPAPQILRVYNAGTGTLDWAVEPENPGETIPDWLIIEPVEGSITVTDPNTDPNTVDVSISVDVTGLPDGL